MNFEIGHSIVGLTPTHGDRGPDVRVLFSHSASCDLENTAWIPLYRSTECDLNGEPMLVIERNSADESLRMRYGDGTTFLINHSASEVHVDWTLPLTADDAATYLVAPVFGLLLYRRGLTCLHASAIAHEDRALIFVGAAEAGKSTLAALYARHGYKVLSDDIVVLDEFEGSIVARPGIPRIGLWPDSVEYLWGDRDALPKQVATWDKRYLDLASEELFQHFPLPVGAVYVLSDRLSDAEPRIEELHGTDALLPLVANKYVTRVSQRERNGSDFVLLSKLASSVPVFRVERRDALSELDAVSAAIIEDYGRRSSRNSA